MLQFQDKVTLEQFANKVIQDYGHVDYLINNTAPLFKGIKECSLAVNLGRIHNH